MATEQESNQPGKKRVIKLRGFFIDPDGGLRRGVPIVGQDKDGNEIVVNREHNTGKIFPIDSQDTQIKEDTPPPQE